MFYDRSPCNGGNICGNASGIPVRSSRGPTLEYEGLISCGYRWKTWTAKVCSYTLDRVKALDPRTASHDHGAIYCYTYSRDAALIDSRYSVIYVISGGFV